MYETNSRPLGRPADPRNPGLCVDDADALLAINAHVVSPSPEWIEFLGETLSTWLVEHRSPAGVVDDAKAHWLISRIDEGGAVTSPGSLALLRRCCVKARTVPATLLAYLRQQENRTRAQTSDRLGGERRMTGA
jgi:hypothetical protein